MVVFASLDMSITFAEVYRFYELEGGAMPVRVNLKRLEESIVKFESAPVVKSPRLFYGDSFFTRWMPERWCDLRLDVLAAKAARSAH